MINELIRDVRSQRLTRAVRDWLRRLGLTRFNLQPSVTDDGRWETLLLQAGGGPNDRRWHEIRDDLTDALEAWRKNFLVRQVVRLTTAYVVGDGIEVSSRRREVHRFVQEFWTHRQNRLEQRLPAWCDELTRSGELFIALFSNPADGMSYVRAIPAGQIEQVQTAPDDYEREIGYLEIIPGQLERKPWPSLHTAEPDEPVLLHYTINKPVGATRGESDLTPVLPWARRYTEWLRERVRFNRLRNDLSAVVVKLEDDSQVERKRQQYTANPPTAGSIVVMGRGEEISFPAANIQAGDASPDGRAIRLAVATAANVPLHFFAEGDTANRATAVEMGDPTHRHYRMRQRDFKFILLDLCAQAYWRKVALGLARLPGNGDLQLQADAPDISRHDNELLARSAKTIVEALAVMRAQAWVDDETAIRLAFKFAGEIISEEKIQQILREKVAEGAGGLGGSSPHHPPPPHAPKENSQSEKSRRYDQ
jgi:hypothetical protein